jgi:hypothetical protein
MALVDVVNFNADGSCLPARKWLRCLQGDEQSLVMDMLRNYVRHERKVNLGITGATVKDIAYFNPQAIAYINAHPHIFQMLPRPFAHDNGLLRLPAGFTYNLEQGLACIRSTFTHVSDYYLPPEIMLTGEQIAILHEHHIRGVFVHKSRYSMSVQQHIPEHPFILYGILDTPMWCIPFAHGTLESHYLGALRGAIASETWAHAAAEKAEHGTLAIWRDGESCLLTPLGVAYEAHIFQAEAAAGVERQFLSEMTLTEQTSTASSAPRLRYFPQHSLGPWLKEMKLFWLVARVRDIEQEFSRLNEHERLLWSLVINSDILSAVEKEPPVVPVSVEVLRVDQQHMSWEGVLPLPEQGKVVLTRSERAGEGEDYLAYLELLRARRLSLHEICQHWRDVQHPHLLKALARVWGAAEQPS